MRIRFSSIGSFPLMAASLLLTSGLASASPILGNFGFTGPGVLTFSSSGDFIDFCASVTGLTCNNNGSGKGDINVTGPGTNSFAVLSSATTGTIDDLTDVTPPAPGYTYLPVGSPVSVDNIIALAGFSTWDFQANILPLATCTASPTQQCVGPFQLDQNGTNVAVVMNIYGTLINTTDGSRSALDIAITGNYAATTIAAVVAGAESPGGVLSNSFSASVTASAVPEPATSGLILLGSGLLLLGRKVQRRKS